MACISAVRSQILLKLIYGKNKYLLSFFLKVIPTSFSTDDVEMGRYQHYGSYTPEPRSIAHQTGGVCHFRCQGHVCLFLVIILIITTIFLHTFIENRTQTLHSNYVRFQYGDTVETTARTYANLIKFHSERLQSGIGIGADMTNIFLIGAGETVEAYLRHDREFADDDILQSLLPQAQPFVFGTITDALHTLDDLCCTSKRKLLRTLFVLLLISTRDPLLERHEHEAFQYGC